MCAALDIKLFPFFHITSLGQCWKKASHSEMLCCYPLLYSRGGAGGVYLVQDVGMACWDRLAVSGVYLCFFPQRISGEVMAVRGIQPACSTCYIPGYSSSCGQCFILPLRCRDCVSLKRLSGQ